jgi:flagellar biosynthesis protein FlhF
LHAVETVAELRKMVAGIPPETFAVIDTAGANPFNTSDMSTLSRMVEGDLVEPILITPAGGDVAEAAEAGEAFRTLGIRRMSFTRLDMARRLGALLTTAEAGDFAFSEVSISPHVARGLRPLSALALSRLLMRDPNKALTQLTRGEAAQ